MSQPASVWRGLITFHPESLSAWTMVAAVAHGAYLAAQSGGAWRNVLLFLHTFIHAPFSIGYHACRETCPDRAALFRKDAAFIFISGILVHVAVSKDPRVFAITLPLYIVLVLQAIESITKEKTKDGMKAASMRYIVVLLLSYIPICLEHGIKAIFSHLCMFVIVYIVYSKRLKYSSATMHCGVILNNWILHMLV